MILNIRKSDNRLIDLDQFYDENRFDNIDIDDIKLDHASCQNYSLDGDRLRLLDQPSLDAKPQFVLLLARQSYGENHAHAASQIVNVLHGEISTGKENIKTGESVHIQAGEEHVLVGVAPASLIVTVFFKALQEDILITRK